ncbi:septin-interacting protein 1 [Toxorhynchites rutilus septentrionalis]|uniref:septin-interacting protein 1 n=1 Tax=Toxorhynchites rutilus septentrionalis TaxID=329112 RepID=UPI002479AE8C|nr:septin-interacting protein 1 [Toxorhynchites rutilus septentrionalis]
MADEEYERFEITDYDLDNEFNPNRRNRRPTKQQQIYGIWADDDSENEHDDGEAGPSSRRGRGRAGKTAKDYSAPIGFVAGGIQQAGKKKEEKHESDEEDDDDEADERPRLGGAASGTSSESESEAQAKANDFRSMAGFRKFTAQTAQLGKGVGNWEQHTKGIGAKLLLQMGYQPGKGLGKNLQGIAAPVEAHLRKGRGAIGAYGPEKKRVVLDQKQKQLKEDAIEIQDKDAGQQWRKDKHKGRYFYKSVEDVIEKGKRSYAPFDKNSKLSQVKVIDMTGPESRVLSGYHALGQAKIADEDLFESKPTKETSNFALPELMHNLNLMVEFCEQDIISIDKQKCAAKDREEQLEIEKDNLIRITQLEKDYIETLEGALELVRALVEPEDGSVSLEECEKIFVRMQTDFPSEYKEFGLDDLAPGVVAPLIAARLKEWNPFIDPTRHLDLFKRWRSILGSSDTEKRNLLDPYCGLVWSGVIPSIRSAASAWDPRIHQPMIALLDAWAPLLPSWILDNVLEQIVMSKLNAAVTEWDPLTDTIPIHVWIQPWAGILGSKMEQNIYPTIREKLSKALKAWNPEDRSARAMITPWKGVMAEEDLQVFLTKNIIPKLELRLTELVINPLQQDLEIFNQVWEWNEIISSIQMANILDKYFFPKWIQTLVIWLNQSPNFDQVTRWYQGWKSQFTDDIIRQTNIKENFRKALELMQRSIGITTGASTSGPTEPMDTTPSAPKPPSLMDVHVDAPPSLEFKELVSQKCAERGIIFAPMPGRREMGKQVYRVGKLFCYIDRSVCIVSLDGGVNWTPISLSALMERAVSG